MKKMESNPSVPGMSLTMWLPNSSTLLKQLFCSKNECNDKVKLFI